MRSRIGDCEGRVEYIRSSSLPFPWNPLQPSLLVWALKVSKGTAMKSAILAFVLATVPAVAVAQPIGTTLSMSCDQARGIIAIWGAAVLRTGPTTYDRYVRDASFCARQEVIRPAWVRTVDMAQCPIGGVCRSIEIDNGQ